MITAPVVHNVSSDIHKLRVNTSISSQLSGGAYAASQIIDPRCQVS